MRRVLLLLLVATTASAAEPRHIIYLHGRIVQEQQSPRPRHDEYGYYEFDEIAEALRSRGFVVSAGIRPKGTSVSEGADRVVAEVRSLLKSGVPPERITIVGASMGAAIAFRVAARLQHPDIRFALLSPCLSLSIPHVAEEEGNAPAGQMLVVREESDVPAASCPPLETSPANLHAVEIIINTGRGHGFLYQPLKEWVEPVAAWAAGETVDPPR